MPPRDPAHWLYRFAPREWLRAAMGDLARAEQALALGDRRGALTGCRRAAGLALNGMLAASGALDVRYGRTYMEHLAALESDAAVPEEARRSARMLLQTSLPGAPVVSLHTPTTDQKLLEAARTVMAHAYALVLRAEPLDGGGEAGGEPGGGEDAG